MPSARSSHVCGCAMCRRNEALQMALYTGDVRTIEEVYDDQFEEAACLEMDLAYAVSMLQLISEQPERAGELAQDALDVLRHLRRVAEEAPANAS